MIKLLPFISDRFESILPCFLMAGLMRPANVGTMFGSETVPLPACVGIQFFLEFNGINARKLTGIRPSRVFSSKRVVISVCVCVCVRDRQKLVDDFGQI